MIRIYSLFIIFLDQKRGLKAPFYMEQKNIKNSNHKQYQ